MKRRALTIVCILLFSFTIYSLSFVYGPLRRSFASPGKSRQVFTSAEIGGLWETEAVRGRIAVLFTRRLNAEETADSDADVKYVYLAMNHGIIRTVYHIVPDGAWPEVMDNLSRWPIVRPVPGGLVAVLENGRVYVLPLSNLKPIDEKALVVIEPGVWKRAELAHIADLVKGGSVTTDLLAVIRGSSSDLAMFCSAASSCEQ